MTAGRSPANGTRGEQGFTLIEILLGLTLLALVLGVVQGVYSGVLRSRDFVQGQTDRSHAAALLLHRMADELFSAVPPSEDDTANEDTGLVVDKDANLDSTLEFSALLPPLLEETGEAGSKSKDSKTGGVARIGYRLERAEDGSLDLVRTDSRRSDEPGSTASSQDAKGDALLRGVSRFRVKLLAEGETWRETSSGTGSAEQGSAPRAVSIEVAWKEGKKGEGAERVLRTAVPLYANLGQP